jgi:hypothetical protein
MARTTNPNPLIIGIGITLLTLGIAYAVCGWVHGWHGLFLYSPAVINVGFAMVLTEALIWRGRKRRRG